MKKIIAGFYLFVNISILLFFTGCKSNEQTYQKKIGITQFQNADWMNTVRRGFIDGLKEKNFFKDYPTKLDTLIADESVINSNQIAQKFIDDKVDLIFAISTPSAQACANKTNKIPIVFGAITDPVSAKLVKTEKSSGNNLTGTSDRWPVKQQLNFFKEINPNFKKLGVINNPGEDNSVYVMNQVNEAVKDLGFELITATATNVSEVYMAVKSIVNRCDGIYIAGSNVVIQGAPSIIKACEEEHIPLISGEPSSVYKGAILTYSVNYYQIGKLSSELAYQILKYSKNPSELPVIIPDKYDLIINLKAANAYKLKLPQSLIAKANDIIK